MTKLMSYVREKVCSSATAPFIDTANVSAAGYESRSGAALSSVAPVGMGDSSLSGVGCTDSVEADNVKARRSVVSVGGCFV